MWLANDMTYKETKHTTNTTKSVCIQCMVAHTVLLAVGVPTVATTAAAILKLFIIAGVVSAGETLLILNDFGLVKV